MKERTRGITITNSNFYWVFANKERKALENADKNEKKHMWRGETIRVVMKKRITFLITCEHY